VSNKRGFQDGKPKAANALTHHVAESLLKELLEFWENRENKQGLNEIAHLRRILFGKTRHPVPADLWIPGASQPGEQQYVVAVVSQEHVLRQLRGVLDLRHTWLQQNGLPLNFQMRDKLERPEFIEWRRNQYEQEEYQQQRQQEDFNKGGNKKMRSGKRSRWSREQQRRCGSPAMWAIISFSGRYDADFLQQAQALDTQPDEQDNVAQDNVPQELTRTAIRCRDDLRRAEHFARKREAGRKRFSSAEQQMLDDLDSGFLLHRANEATRASGHGRLKNPDGTFQDIGAHMGGLARTVLDNWGPRVLPHEEDESESEDDAGLLEDEPVCYS
jgi:hypothetical protein